MRDASPPYGLPGGARGDAPGGGPFPPGRRGPGPRHLAGARSPDRAGPVLGDGPYTPQDGDATAPGDGRGEDDDSWSHQPRHNAWRTVLEWVAVVACGVLIALTAQAFLVQAFWIPSPSMTPTLEVGDRVLVNKLAYRTHEVHRGDLVVFERPPQSSGGEGADGEIKDLIKRVVAVGGDTLEARDGQVYVNDERIEEPYLVDGTPTDNLPRQVIPEGFVFVMGDNRTNSQDSRYFGPIDEDTIVGRAFVKVLPVGDLGWL